MNFSVHRAVAAVLATASTALLPPLPATAGVPASSAYHVDPQSSHVQDATSEQIQTVNMITCIISAVRADALVNKGDYVALVDKTKCDSKASGDGTQAADYMTAVVNSTRASNAEPMRAKIWIENEEGGTSR